ncbi:MAG: hypothetical protein P8X64_05460 [Anaerolineales bacterium]
MSTKPRPRLVTCLSLAVLTFSAVQFASVLAWLRLVPLELTLPAWYLPARSLVWGLVGIVAALGLFLGWSWSRRFTRYSAVVYLLWYWADRLILRSSTTARQTLWFYGGLQFLATLLILWVLGRKGTRAYFEE